MANASQFDLIMCTIAVVFQPGDRPIQIGASQEALTAILRRPLTIGEMPGGMIISSNRDQVDVHILGNKVDVREVSGDINQATNKIPRVTHEFMAMLGDMTFQTYGVNFILEAGVESPMEWLGDKLLNPELASVLGTSPSSNIVSVIFEQPPKKLTVRLETLLGDRLNINFNASESAGSLPSQEELGNEIGKQYGELKEFLGKLGL